MNVENSPRVTNDKGWLLIVMNFFTLTPSKIGLYDIANYVYMCTLQVIFAFSKLIINTINII